jgi:hypothetical protein
MERLLGTIALIIFLQAGISVRMAEPGGFAPPGWKIPLWLKVLYTLFLCVLVPAYWNHYGPANFLWFSDIALLATLAALWLENRFLASMQAVSATMLELFWVVDFLAKLMAGVHVGGISQYMFEPERPLFIRGLSLFHLWLPFLLLWLVWRLGYDRRAWVAQTLLAWLVLPLCYFLTDPSRNLNWVFGPGETAQRWMPPGLYLALLMLFFPLGVYLPTHLVLKKIFEERGGLSAGTRGLPGPSGELRAL